MTPRVITPARILPGPLLPPSHGRGGASPNLADDHLHEPGHSRTFPRHEIIDRAPFPAHLPALPQGQFPKFDGYTGICQDGATRCDLFLLSWTLTPVTAVWEVSQPANACLGSEVATKGTNAAGRIINALYTDYVEYARSSDVALVRNGCAPVPRPPVAVRFTAVTEPSVDAATTA